MIDDVKFPANVITMNKLLLFVVKFDLFPTGKIDDELFVMPPEEEPYNDAFEQSEYESRFFAGNIGFVLWIVAIYLTLIVIYLVTYCIPFMRRRLGKYLFWNTGITLLMENYQEILLVSILNLDNLDWESEYPAVIASHYMSIIGVTLTTFFFLQLIIYFLFKN